MNNRKTNQQLTEKFRDKASVPDNAIIRDLIVSQLSSRLHTESASVFVPKMQINSSWGNMSSCLIQQMSNFFP